MNIGSRFRKDLGYYMLGVIIPGLINAATIPLLKRILGSAEFGRYGIRYNFLLLLTAFSVGWICQSIIRFKFSVAGEEQEFYRRTFFLGSVVSVSLAVMGFGISMFYYHYGFIFSALYSVAIVLCGYQNILIGVSQANFLSRVTMYSEAIRTAVFFITAMVLLRLNRIADLNALFLALVISYFISALILLKRNKLAPVLFKSGQKVTKTFRVKGLLSYGLPLAAWYLASYLLLFMDKPLLAKNMGYEVQGNYQALYEIISKGAMVLLIPVTNAIFPLLSDAFEKDNRATGMRLLKKIIFIELAILIAGLVSYWLFGFTILRYLLSVPGTADYKLSGFLMLASILIWQIGMLVHKPFELKMRTTIMLWIVLASIAVFLVLFFLLKIYKPVKVYFYATPFLFASTCYVALCLIMVGYHKKVKMHLQRAGSIVKEKLFG